MDTMDSNLLISVIGGLGRWVDSDDGQQEYIKDDDCLDCLKDLQRFLRQDHERTREVFFTLGKYRTARTDLVPLITAHATDTDIVYNALKVVTFLTMPIDPESDNHSLQVEMMLDVKDAMLAQDAIAVVVALVEQPLMRHADGLMTERDVLIVQLVITYLRNLVVIPDPTSTAGSSGSHKSGMSAKLLKRLSDDSALELLLVMAQHTTRGALRSEAPLLLEVFTALFDLAEPQAVLAAPSLQAARRAHAPASNRGNTAEAAMARPQPPRSRAQRGQAAASNGATKVQGRHPRFGGVFTTKADFSGSRARISIGRANFQDTLGPVASVAASAGKEGKPQPAFDEEARAILKEYAGQFLAAGYGLLMEGLRRDLEPGLNISRLSEDDFLRFFKLAAFCTAFVRLQQEEAQKTRQKEGSTNEDTEDSPFASISATMGWDTFHLVQSVWLSIIDLPAAAPGNKWELQHASLGLLKEMLLTLDIAQKTGNAADKKAADRLQRRLLHDDQKESGLLPVLARLVKQFVFKFQTKQHAKDLIQALHVVLRMLERLTREEAGGFLVQRKAAATRRRKAASKQQTADDDDNDHDAGKTDGQDAEKQNGEHIEAGIEEGSAQQPMDVEAGEEPQAGLGDEAAQRAAQSLGSQASEAGGDDARPGTVPTPQERDKDPLEELFEEEEQDWHEEERRVKEVAVNLQQRIRQELAYPAVVHFYIWLLQGYSTNGRFVNHCLVAFLRRLAHPESLNLEPMLYQMYILRVFHQMLSDAAYRRQPGASEVLGFAAQTVRNVFAKLVPAEENETNKADTLAGLEDEPASSQAKSEGMLRKGLAAMTFVELLFWKNVHDSEQVREEYHWKARFRPQEHRRGAGLDDSDASSSGAEDGGGPDGLPGAGQRKSKKKKKTGGRTQADFSEEDTVRLGQLFEQYGNQKGYVDTIQQELGGKFPRSQVQRQLKALGLKKGQLTANQKAVLQQLFEQNKGKRDCLATLAAEVPGGFSKGQIRNHLRRLGLQLQKQSARADSVSMESDPKSGASSDDSASDSDASSSSASKGQAGRRSGQSGARSEAQSESESEDEAKPETVSAKVKGGKSQRQKSNSPAASKADSKGAASTEHVRSQPGRKQSCISRKRQSPLPANDESSDEAPMHQSAPSKARHAAQPSPADVDEDDAEVLLEDDGDAELLQILQETTNNQAAKERAAPRIAREAPAAAAPKKRKLSRISEQPMAAALVIDLGLEDLEDDI